MLTFTSCQAANADPFCRAVVQYAAARLSRPTRFVEDLPWQERARQLDRGEIQVGWICGRPYIRKIDEQKLPLELLAAPVMAAQRYQGRPVYFSDVVVRQDSPFYQFADLRGARWAYNEPDSFSGYWTVCHHLAALGETGAYFGRVVASGAHQTSLQMILTGEVDGSAIDSTVLETELACQPALAGQIRIIATLGPSPIPPWVISTHLELSLREAIRTAWLTMHQDAAGRAILQQGGVARFAAVTDADYNPIRAMVAVGQQAKLNLLP